MAVFTLLIIWGVYYQKKIAKSRFNTIKAFADKHSLVYEIEQLKKGVAELSGTLNAIPFHYYERRMPLTDPDNPVFWTVLQFDKSAFDFNFKISQEVGFMKAAKVVGFNDVLLGEKVVDDAFYFQTDSPEKLKSVFTTEKQQELLQIKEHLNGIVNNNSNENTFTYYYFGRIQQAFQIAPVEEVLAFMTKIQPNKPA